MDVVCVGTGATIRGQTIDISRSGMLVSARDASLPPVGAADLVPLAFLVAAAFSDGMRVVLGPDVTVRAEVLRVTTSPADRGFLRLGLRFRRTLTRQQCAKIGIDETDIPDPSLDLTPDLEFAPPVEASGDTAVSKADPTEGEAPDA